jgi:putative ABC transport system substrate-binding protein
MRSKLLFWLPMAVLLMTGSIQAQPTGQIFRIGYLDPITVSESAARLETFRQELSKLGWIEGKNLVFEYRFAEQKPERVPELAAELVRLKVDLIVTSGVPPALEAKKATSTIPIVMVTAGDPVGGACWESGAAGRQCHWDLEFSGRAKHQKAGDTQGRSSQARSSWTAAAAAGS